MGSSPFKPVYSFEQEGKSLQLIPQLVVLLPSLITLLVIALSPTAAQIVLLALQCPSGGQHNKPSLEAALQVCLPGGVGGWVDWGALGRIQLTKGI